ncbi:MAG: radical SAM protein [Candidatus Woesearchaeota archaeon]
MNLILTTGCNKGCSYCFAKNVREEYGVNTMTMETFNTLLDKIEKLKDPHAKLLGGEPTTHPQFIEMLDELIKRKIPTTIISNFLFNEEIRNKIIELIKNVKVEFLVNGSDLEHNNLIEKWAANYNYIYKFLYNFDIEEQMKVGYTIEKDKSWKYYVKYTDFLLKHIHKIERLRLSLDFPGDEKRKNDFYFINNTDLGETFLILTKKALDIGARPSIDCIIYPCMFENKEEFKYIRKFSETFKTKCDGVPFDVFPNQEAIYCYPLKKLAINTTEYNDLDAAVGELKNKANDIKKNIQVPEECQKCSFYGAECAGPCLGFFKLEGMND